MKCKNLKDGLNFSYNGGGVAYLLQSVAIHFKLKVFHRTGSLKKRETGEFARSGEKWSFLTAPAGFQDSQDPVWISVCLAGCLDGRKSQLTVLHRKTYGHFILQALRDRASHVIWVLQSRRIASQID